MAAQRFYHLNIIRFNQLYEDEFYLEYDRANIEELVPVPAEENAENYAALNTWKEQIAEVMWNDYLEARDRHG